MFLLTIALTLFTLMEFVVRRQLAVAQQSLSGLYPGLPKRKTSRPTSEKLLAAFSELTFLDNFLNERTESQKMIAT